MVVVNQGRLIRQSDGVGVYEAEFTEPVTLFAFVRYLEHNTQVAKGKVINEDSRILIGNVVLSYEANKVKYAKGFEAYCNSSIKLLRMEAGKDGINYVISFEEIEVV